LIEARIYVKLNIMISREVKGTNLHIGDTLRVHTEVTEGAKTRIQVYEGILISMRGRAENASFTVRRISASGTGIERTWPMDAKSIVKIEVKKSADNVRRAKLYYLRERTGKQAVRV
jgi:large subunit ribosomal protein L19